MNRKRLFRGSSDSLISAKFFEPACAEASADRAVLFGGRFRFPRLSNQLDRRVFNIYKHVRGFLRAMCWSMSYKNSSEPAPDGTLHIVAPGEMSCANATLG